MHRKKLKGNDPTSPLVLRTETDPVSEKLYFLICRIPDDGESPKTQ
jgi:hypothetical protein